MYLRAIGAKRERKTCSMGRKSKSNKSKKKRSQPAQVRSREGSSSGAPSSRGIQHPTNSNFVPSAGPGCYIAHLSSSSTSAAEAATDSELANDWVLGVEPFHPHEFDPDVDIPEIALDPDEFTVSVTNATPNRRVCYVTVYDTVLLGRGGQELQSGVSVDNDGNRRDCTTFIVLCPPATFVHLCHLELKGNQTLSDVDIDSDVRDYESHPNPDDTHPLRIGFPLRRPDGIDGFLCTQGVGGLLTHYMTGNYHAVDFRCPVGTPCLAVCDGIVVDCDDRNSLTGVAVGNLFKWNSILIKADEDENDTDGDDNNCDNASGGGSLYFEYVHIQTSSICVKPGDKVEKGQMICKSGSVGFSPEPHLHFSAFRSNEPTAPTVRVWFESKDECKEAFIPRAGSNYNENGALDRTA
mmetsp:Transcript_5101/g.11103  ORF Transcript_5101/g.11103 Transcript_5101/m.11103 type:complete len:409 (-) Transcript_5101:16-1242(-)